MVPRSTSDARVCTSPSAREKPAAAAGGARARTNTVTSTDCVPVSYLLSGRTDMMVSRKFRDELEDYIRGGNKTKQPEDDIVKAPPAEPSPKRAAQRTSVPNKSKRRVSGTIFPCGRATVEQLDFVEALHAQEEQEVFSKTPSGDQNNVEKQESSTTSSSSTAKFDVASSDNHYYLTETQRRRRDKVEYCLRSGRPPAEFHCDDPAEVCPYLFIGSMQSACGPTLRRHQIHYLVNACATVSSCTTAGPSPVVSSEEHHQLLSNSTASSLTSSSTAASVNRTSTSSTAGGEAGNELGEEQHQQRKRVPKTASMTLDRLLADRTFSLALSDHPRFALSRRCMDEMVAFVDRARESKRAVLIFCARGVSRCATACCWYLLCSRLSSSVAGALSMMSRARPVVDPNKGFRKQLKDLETEINEFGQIGDRFLKETEARRDSVLAEHDRTTRTKDKTPQQHVDLKEGQDGASGEFVDDAKFASKTELAQMTAQDDHAGVCEKETLMARKIDLVSRLEGGGEIGHVSEEASTTDVSSTAYSATDTEKD